jgi:hypothetical protein
LEVVAEVRRDGVDVSLVAPLGDAVEAGRAGEDVPLAEDLEVVAEGLGVVAEVGRAGVVAQMAPGVPEVAAALAVFETTPVRVAD